MPDLVLIHSNGSLVTCTIEYYLLEQCDVGWYTVTAVCLSSKVRCNWWMDADELIEIPNDWWLL